MLSSSSKSSMSSTVSSFSWVELNDSDLDTADTSGDDANIGGGVEMGIVGGVEKGTGGGALFGGEPEDSGFVTKKNSSADPPLFWNRQNDQAYKDD